MKIVVIHILKENANKVSFISFSFRSNDKARRGTGLSHIISQFSGINSDGEINGLIDVRLPLSYLLKITYF